MRSAKQVKNVVNMMILAGLAASASLNQAIASPESGPSIPNYSTDCPSQGSSPSNSSYSPECTKFRQPSGVTTRDNLYSSVRTQSRALHNNANDGAWGRNGDVRPGTPYAEYRARETGKSAGDGAYFDYPPFAIWSNFGLVNSSSDNPTTSFDSSLYAALIGLDISPIDNFVAGAAFGVEQTDNDTNYNLGEQSNTGYTIAPYLGYVINNTFSFDVSGAYTWLDLEQFRTDPGAFGVRTQVDGDTNATRWFAAGNLNALKVVNNLVLTGSIGAFYAEEDIDGYTETSRFPANPLLVPLQMVGSEKVKLGQFQVGGELAYSVMQVEPFVNAYYEYDFKRQNLAAAVGQVTPSNDKDGVRVGGGIRYFGPYGISGILEYNGIGGRDAFKSQGINLTARFEY